MEESDDKQTGEPTLLLDEFTVGETIVSTSGSKPQSNSTFPGGDTTELAGRVAGRYEILGLVGRGGMGNVYRVRDIELDEVVALKTLHSQLATSEVAIERFRAEVRLARRVTHRNVARTFDIGMYEGIPFLTMEFVEGDALDRLLEVEPLRPAQMLEVVSDVCDGLIAAHEAGVIHQDLKPQNVIIEKGGRVVISDFGIARARDATGDTIGAKGFVGTPAYMSPEQVNGAERLDGRADIYALGVMMYEMLSGRLPFGGATPLAVALARMLAPAPELPVEMSISGDVRALVKRCLERDRDARFADVSELRRAIVNALGSVATGAHAQIQPIAPPRDEKSIAVLPLRFRSSGDDSHLRDGIGEELVDGLSMCAGLRVKPRGAVQRYADESDPQVAGKHLGVQVVVEGSVRVDGARLMVRLAAISVDDGFQLWAKRFDGDAANVFQICEEAVAAIATALTVENSRGPAKILTDPVTIDLYLRARKLMWTHWQSQTELARPLWEQVLARAPDDPRVLAGAATYFARLNHLQGAAGRAVEDLSVRARSYAERANQAAPHWPEPYCAKAVLAWNAFDLGAALREARAAVDVAPGCVEALLLAGKILLEIGPLSEAIEHLRRALELDPLEFNARWELARGLALMQAWDEVDALLATDVTLPEHQFALALLRHRTDLWRSEPQWLDDPIPQPVGAGELAFYVPGVKHLLRTGKLPGEYETLMGILDNFAASSTRTGSVGYQHGAEWSLRVGELEMARESLRKSVQAGLVDLMWLEHCPLLAPLRDTTDFVELLETVRSRVTEIHRAALLQGRRLTER